MDILNFLIHLLSGATLLLFSVRFMRIGIERLWGVKIFNRLAEQISALSLIVRGGGLGFLMQGGTVVMLMAASMAGNGTIPLLSAAYLAIGADLGSAVAVMALSLPVGTIGPLAILVGGWSYLNATDVRRRNLGRVVLGLGLIFLSLSLIRQTVAPLQAFSGINSAVFYFNGDVVSAALFGAVLTLIMHSGLAAVLTAVAFASHGTLGAIGGLGFVVGCNVGSALLPIWLLRSESAEARTVAKCVAFLRTALAAISLAVLSAVPNAFDAFFGLSAAQTLLAGHILFNAALMMSAPALPLIIALSRPKHPEVPDNALNSAVDSQDPAYQRAAIKGQVNQMLDLLLRMFDLATSDGADLTQTEQIEQQLNNRLSQVRETYSKMPELSEEDSQILRRVMDFAIRIESAGDILNGKVVTIHNDAARGDFAFSTVGKQEITALAFQTRKGIILAQNVFWSDDRVAARGLVEHKQFVAGLEAESKRQHLIRVRNGSPQSLGSSDAHLELIGALKSVNSKLASVGYDILQRAGDLSKTRLKSHKIKGSRKLRDSKDA